MMRTATRIAEIPEDQHELLHGLVQGDEIRVEFDGAQPVDIGEIYKLHGCLVGGIDMITASEAGLHNLNHFAYVPRGTKWSGYTTYQFKLGKRPDRAMFLLSKLADRGLIKSIELLRPEVGGGVTD